MCKLHLFQSMELQKNKKIILKEKKSFMILQYSIKKISRFPKKFKIFTIWVFFLDVKGEI
jgi:hypothetical protein